MGSLYIVTADRGYESYNNMAHIQEKGWFYLIQVKDFGKYKIGILHGLDLPDTEEFDEYIDLNLTRKQPNEEFIAAEEYISMDTT